MRDWKQGGVPNENVGHQGKPPGIVGKRVASLFQGESPQKRHTGVEMIQHDQHPFQLKGVKPLICGKSSRVEGVNISTKPPTAPSRINMKQRHELQLEVEHRIVFLRVPQADGCPFGSP